MAVVCVEGMMAMIGKMRIFIYRIENIGYISTKRDEILDNHRIIEDSIKWLFIYTKTFSLVS